MAENLIQLDLRMTKKRKKSIENQFKISNNFFLDCIRELSIRLQLMRKNSSFHESFKITDFEKRKNDILNLSNKYGLSKESIPYIIEKINNKNQYSKDLSNQNLQIIANKALKMIQSFIFKKGIPSFGKSNKLKSITLNYGIDGITFENDILNWNGLKLPCKINGPIDHTQIKQCQLFKQKSHWKIRLFLDDPSQIQKKATF